MLTKPTSLSKVRAAACLPTRWLKAGFLCLMLRNLGSEGAFRMLDAYLRRMSSDRTPSPEAADDVSTTGGGAGAAARSFTSTAAVVAATCVSTATSSTACCLRTSAAWPSARSDSCNMTLRVVGSVPSASKDASAPDTHRALDELELIDSEMRVGAEAVGSAVGGAGVTAGTSSSSSGCTSAAMSAEDGSGAEVTAERVSLVTDDSTATSLVSETFSSIGSPCVTVRKRRRAAEPGLMPRSESVVERNSDQPVTGLP
mmetsp:Transcript_2921/g.8668  ORF Transcript_2921/g.8668 Transcript_2921/m.8668 type:complete len:257 (+) Transcript_2921:1653-2423(+)